MKKTLTLSPKQIASLLQINTLLYQNKFYSLEVITGLYVRLEILVL